MTDLCKKNVFLSFFFFEETLNLFGLLLTTVTQSSECELLLTSAGEHFGSRFADNGGS